MEIIRINQSDRMSKITVYNNIVYLSGQVAEDVNDGIQGQTKSCLSKIEMLLNEGGSDKEHILSTTIYLRDMKGFNSMNEVWNNWIIKGKKPTRTCVQAEMARESILIEITVTAAVI